MLMYDENSICDQTVFNATTIKKGRFFNDIRDIIYSGKDYFDPISYSLDQKWGCSKFYASNLGKFQARKCSTIYCIWENKKRSISDWYEKANDDNKFSRELVWSK